MLKVKLTFSDKTSIKHIITNPEGHRGKGDCSICGPVEVRNNGNGWYKCLNALVINDRIQTFRKRGIQLTHEEATAPEACEVCGSVGSLRLDHNHYTLEVRGWLCHNCNVALGFAMDSPTRLRLLADYLDSRGSYEDINKI